MCVCVTVLVLAPSAAWGQLPPPPKPAAQEGAAAPRIFVQQSVLDLGVVLEGDRAPIQWTIENRGTADLVILRIRAGCGCTVLESPDEKRTVPPGHTHVLKAEFDSTSRFGMQDKSIVVYSNDPIEPELKLELRAVVERLFDRTPQTALNLRMLQRGDTAEQTLDIMPVEGRNKATVVAVHFDGGMELLTRVEPIPLDGSRAGSRVYFSIPSDATLGTVTLRADVQLEVDGIPRKTLLILRGQITGDLTWIPRVIDASRQPVIHGTRLAPLSIKSPTGTPFRILSAEAGPVLDVVVTDTKPLKPGTEYDVVPVVREDAPSGPFGDSLTVRTSSLDQPIVEVPVFGIVAAKLLIDPPLVLLRADGSPKGTTRRVKLQAAPTQSLAISRITTGLRAVQAAEDVESTGAQKHVRYLMARYAGGLESGTHETFVDLTTGVPGMESVRIPVVIEVPE